MAIGAALLLPGFLPLPGAGNLVHKPLGIGKDGDSDFWKGTTIWQSSQSI